MSAYRVTCPGCAAKIQVKSSLLGKSARCPKCQELIRIPEAEEDDDSTPSGIEVDEGATREEELLEQGHVRWRCPRCRKESFVPQGQEPLLCQDCMNAPASSRTIRSVNYIASRPSTREPSAGEGCAYLACQLLLFLGLMGMALALFVVVMTVSGNAPLVSVPIAAGGGLSSLIMIAIGGVGAALLKGKN